MTRFLRAGKIGSNRRGCRGILLMVCPFTLIHRQQVLASGLARPRSPKRAALSAAPRIGSAAVNAAGAKKQHPNVFGDKKGLRFQNSPLPYSQSPDFAATFQLARRLCRLRPTPHSAPPYGF
jgi:hypothetical protein